MLTIILSNYQSCPVPLISIANKKVYTWQLSCSAYTINISIFQEKISNLAFVTVSQTAFLDFLSLNQTFYFVILTIANWILPLNFSCCNSATKKMTQISLVTFEDSLETETVDDSSPGQLLVYIYSTLCPENFIRLLHGSITFVGFLSNML